MKTVNKVISDKSIYFALLNANIARWKAETQSDKTQLTAYKADFYGFLSDFADQINSQSIDKSIDLFNDDFGFNYELPKRKAKAAKKSDKAPKFESKRKSANKAQAPTLKGAKAPKQAETVNFALPTEKGYYIVKHGKDYVGGQFKSMGEKGDLQAYLSANLDGYGQPKNQSNANTAKQVKALTNGQWALYKGKSAILPEQTQALPPLKPKSAKADKPAKAPKQSEEVNYMQIISDQSAQIAELTRKISELLHMVG